MLVPFYVKWITVFQLWHEPGLEAWIVYTLSEDADQGDDHG